MGLSSQPGKRSGLLPIALRAAGRERMTASARTSPAVLARDSRLDAHPPGVISADQVAARSAGGCNALLDGLGIPVDDLEPADLREVPKIVADQR